MQQSVALQQQLSQRYGAVSPNGTPLPPSQAMQVPPPMMMMQQPQSPSQPTFGAQQQQQQQQSSGTPSIQGQDAYFRAGVSSAFNMVHPPVQPPGYTPASPMKAPQQMVAVPNGAWTTGLFDCFCTDTYVCCGPPWQCLFAENVRKLKGGNGGAASTFWAALCCAMCCPCLSCIYGGQFRSELRQKYGLPAQPYGDCLIYCCCWYCATCQEARELRAREGWHNWRD
jgi:Cys-rich protein (TIGR01571 family)